MCLRTLAIPAALCISTLAVSPTARADLITFAIEGETTLFTDGSGVGWSIPNGTRLSGTYTFDSSTPDSNPIEPESGQYFDTIVDLSLQIGNDALTQTGTFNHIIVHDNFESNDQYNLLDRSVTFRGLGIDFFFGLADAHESVFDSDALPTTPPPLEEFEAAEFILLGDGSEFAVNGLVTSLTLVPEPTTLLLLAGGVVMLRPRRGRTHV